MKDYVQLRLVLLIAGLLFTCSASAEALRYGIGTGIFGLNIDGDMGFDVLNQPVRLDLDLDSDDIKDAKEGAFGLNGFVSSGDWTFLYGVGVLELEDDASSVRNNVPVNAEVTFTSTFLELGLRHRISKQGNHIFALLGGLRYIDHEMETELTIAGVRNKSEKGDDWIDLFIGGSHVYVFSPETAWSTRLDVGAGGSDLTYFFTTGFDWNFAEHWSTRFYGRILSIDYEEGSEGDSDWYLYDADEFGLGVGVVYSW